MAPRPEDIDDPELRGEIELFGEVVAGAAERPGPLSQDEIDRLLGVERDSDPD